MINIAELLKDAPEGTELWCTLYGKVKFIAVNFNINYPINVKLNDNTIEKFDKYGRYYSHFEDSECLLFPSKDCRTWERWKLPSEPKFKVGNKYIQVEWPEYQYFMDGDRWNECIPVIDEDISSYMIPEDYYNEIVHKLEKRN